MWFLLFLLSLCVSTNLHFVSLQALTIKTQPGHSILFVNFTFQLIKQKQISQTDKPMISLSASWLKGTVVAEGEKYPYCKNNKMWWILEGDSNFDGKLLV